MNITNTAIREVKIVNPDVFHDSNGFLIEDFDLEAFGKALDHAIQLVDEHLIHSDRHELMGLHYQLPPPSQEKLVHVTNGQTFQVAVDLRKSSPDFGKWIGTVVSDENRIRFWGARRLRARLRYLIRLCRCLHWRDKGICKRQRALHPLG